MKKIASILAEIKHQHYHHVHSKGGMGSAEHYFPLQKYLDSKTCFLSVNLSVNLSANPVNFYYIMRLVGTYSKLSQLSHTGIQHAVGNIRSLLKNFVYFIRNHTQFLGSTPMLSAKFLLQPPCPPEASFPRRPEHQPVRFNKI